MIFVDVEVKSKKWSEQKNIEKMVQEICAKVILLTELKKILTKNFRLEASFSLVCNSQMKKINFKFCGKNKPTNVLSFASLDEKLIRKDGLKKIIGGANYLFLGDVVIAFETLKKEAIEQKKTFENHLTHLILHSILHLIGFDHEDEKMAEIMENLEVKILKKLKIKNPYI